MSLSFVEKEGPGGAMGEDTTSSRHTWPASLSSVHLSLFQGCCTLIAGKKRVQELFEFKIGFALQMIVRIAWYVQNMSDSYKNT